MKATRRKWNELSKELDGVACAVEKKKRSLGRDDILDFLHLFFVRFLFLALFFLG